MGAKDDGDPFSWDVIDPGQPDTKYPMSIPKSFEGALITFSSNGWLLARKNEDALQFLNPFTRMSGKSPLYHRVSLVSAIGFSSTPICPVWGRDTESMHISSTRGWILVLTRFQLPYLS